ncbi:MAG: hypothetical protein IJ437_07545 [Clostridia bacterium]|nr:hypothetical protein [Clostridia bacterium]
MKKTLRIAALLLVLSMTVFMFAACSNISESYAEKINKANEDGEPLTYSQVIEDLGEENVTDLTLSILGSTNGVIIAVKDCDSWEDIEEKLDNGETVKGISVTIVNNKATSAEYREITEEDK